MKQSASTACLVSSDDMDVGPSPPSMRRNVSFSTITIREYDQTIGDQPCAKGPPVALGWEFKEALDANVEDYEATRKGLRRKGQEMRMPPSIRVQKLLAHGHTQNQIRETAASSRKACLARMRTAKETPAMYQAAKAWESLGRKVKRTVLLRRRSSDELSSLGAATRETAPPKTVLRFRQSDPGVRRVHSMGDFLRNDNDRCNSLTASASYASFDQPRSILKNSANRKNEEVSQAMTAADTESDDSYGNPKHLAQRDTRSNASQMEPAEPLETETDEDEDGIYVI